MRMVIGSESGLMRLYGGIDNVFDEAFTLITDNYGNVKDGGRVSPALADIDQDGFYEMVVGNKRGGLTLYNTELAVGTTAVDDPDDLQINARLYPNPARDIVHLSFGGSTSVQVAQVEIWDSMGRLLMRKADCSNGQEIRIPGYEGMVVAVIHVGSETTIQKLVLVD
jgi:hypothetical protein